MSGKVQELKKPKPWEADLEELRCDVGFIGEEMRSLDQGVNKLDNKVQVMGQQQLNQSLGLQEMQGRSNDMQKRLHRIEQALDGLDERLRRLEAPFRRFAEQWLERKLSQPEVQKSSGGPELPEMGGAYDPNQGKSSLEGKSSIEIRRGC